MTSAEAIGRLSPLRHFIYVTTALARTEFKLRYFGSVLGYLWTFLRPMMLFGVLYVVFTEIVRFGDAVPHYPVVLLTGIVLFSYFSEATSGALSSLVQRENLLRKVSFPRAAIPTAVSLTAAANLVLGVMVVLALALANGVAPTATWALLPLIVAGWIGLATFISLLLSVLFVKFRDLRPMWEVALQVVFWGTPIIYPIEAVPEAYQEAMMHSPLAAVVQQTRHWVIDPQAPSAAQAIGGTTRLLIPFAIACSLVVFSVVMFRRVEGRVAEDV